MKKKTEGIARGRDAGSSEAQQRIGAHMEQLAQGWRRNYLVWPKSAEERANRKLEDFYLCLERIQSDAAAMLRKVQVLAADLCKAFEEAEAERKGRKR